MKKKVSFLISGRGSNFKVVADKILSGKIKAGIGAVISDKADAKGLETAESLGLVSIFVDPKLSSSREEFDREVAALLKKHKTDLVVTAGFMRILSPWFVKTFRNRIINIHPALLPSFPGTGSQKQAVDYGVKIAGCTCHFIDEGTDTGPIIMQAAVKVADDDTADSLSQKILKEEHRILPESVALFCEDRLKVSGRKVKITG